MDEIRFMHITHTLCELDEDVSSSFNGHPVVRVLLLHAIVEKVAASRKFGNEVDFIILLKHFNQVDDVFTIATDVHGICF